MPLRCLAPVFLAMCAIGFVETQARGCACCAPAFTTSEGEWCFSAYEWGELGKLTFTGRFGLLDNGAGEVPPFPYAEGKVSGLFESGSFIFKVKIADKPTTVTLRFRPQEKAKEIKRDMRLISPLADDFNIERAGDALLFKELKLPGKLEIVGDGAAAMGHGLDGRATLVLYGQGNHCFGASDYHQWDLFYSMVSGSNHWPGWAHGRLPSFAGGKPVTR